MAGEGDTGGGGPPPADPATPPPADPATPPADAGAPLLNLDAPPAPLEPPAPTGKAYDWAADPLQLGNLVLGADGTEYTLANRFKGATAKEAVQALETSYVELRKLLGSKGLIAPEAYDLTTEALKDLSAPATEPLVALGKELGLTQAQLEGLAPQLVELQNEIATMTSEQQLAEAWNTKPGTPAYRERIGKIERWVGEAVHNGMFTAEQVADLSRTAGGVQALEALSKQGAERPFWTGSDSRSTAALSLEQARAYVGDTKSAFHDTKHPDHARVKAAVDAAYRSQPGATEVVVR